MPIWPPLASLTEQIRSGEFTELCNLLSLKRPILQSDVSLGLDLTSAANILSHHPACTAPLLRDIAAAEDITI
jgi:hypothetical protein